MTCKIPFLIVIVLCTITTFAQKPSTLKASKVTINGTSSLHDWTSEATKIQWKGVVTVENKKIKNITGVAVTIPVADIKSEKGSTMDKKTWEAFKSDKNPNIIYKLTKVTVVDSKITASGSLTMAGTTKNIDLALVSNVNADGSIRFTGSQKLNMKDYNMVPPKAVMGTIKVGPEVTVNLDLTIEQ
jgi:hypothetical protein